MKHSPHCCIGIAVVACLLAGCDDSSQPPVAEKFEGILRMDNVCTILGGDTSDFMPRPEGFIDTTVVPPMVGPPDNFSLIGACPNPTDRYTEVHFQISERDSVWILAYDHPGGTPVDTIFNRGDNPVGSYTHVWQSPNGPGIYRIVMRSATGFRSYGDVQFTE